MHPGKEPEGELQGVKVRKADLPESLHDLVDRIGIDAVLGLIESRGGNFIYVCQTDRATIAARNRAIKAAFNGVNIPELSARHGLTERQIRRILAE